MDGCSIQDQESGAQQGPRSLRLGPQFFEGILNWLTGFVKLTEEEQEQAGICLGDQYDR